MITNAIQKCAQCGSALTPRVAVSVAKPAPVSDRLLKLADVVTRTQLSKRKLQLDMAAGALAYVKFGRSTRFKAADVDTYIDARRIGRRSIN